MSHSNQTQCHSTIPVSCLMIFGYQSSFVLGWILLTSQRGEWGFGHFFVGMCLGLVNSQCVCAIIFLYFRQRFRAWTEFAINLYTLPISEIGSLHYSKNPHSYIQPHWISHSPNSLPKSMQLYWTFLLGLDRLRGLLDRPCWIPNSPPCSPIWPLHSKWPSSHSVLLDAPSAKL